MFGICGELYLKSSNAKLEIAQTYTEETNFNFEPVEKKKKSQRQL